MRRNPPFQVPFLLPASVCLWVCHCQTYYVTVRAISDAGSVNSTSDGMKVIQLGQVLNGTTVKDGLGCEQENSESCCAGGSALSVWPCFPVILLCSFGNV